MTNQTIRNKLVFKATSYTLTAAAELARVNVEFIIECEQKDIIRPVVLEGRKLLDADTVKKLIRIRHLHHDLGLELSAIDCILHMRRQIILLKRELLEMEQRMTEREKELLEEINRLQNQDALKP